MTPEQIRKLADTCPCLQCEVLRACADLYEATEKHIKWNQGGSASIRLFLVSAANVETAFEKLSEIKP